jgi:hypothetical protein
MNRAVLAPKAAERLAKIAGLLGSDHPGEVCNAASAATKILREHGMTWEALVLRQPAMTISMPAPQAAEPATWQAAVMACLARMDLLTEWERGFVADLRNRRRISAKQARVLSELFDRIRATGGAS